MPRWSAARRQIRAVTNYRPAPRKNFPRGDEAGMKVDAQEKPRHYAPLAMTGWRVKNPPLPPPNRSIRTSGCSVRIPALCATWFGIPPPPAPLAAQVWEGTGSGNASLGKVFPPLLLTPNSKGGRVGTGHCWPIPPKNRT
jgi:hypothetical protein